MKFTLNCRGRILDLSTPAIMAIVNLTPDSFFDGNQITTEYDLLKHVENALNNGALIIDIGGQSTRPNSAVISSDKEWMRIKNGISSIAKEFPNAIISVDTFYSEIARNSVEEGASIINDISGGSFDPEMFDTIGRLKVPYILMHIPNDVSSMHQVPEYPNVVKNVWDYFDTNVSLLKSKGVMDIILDPGFGFGKTVEQNYSLLKNLQAFSNFNSPVLAGLSRKSMINKVLNTNAKDALNGTTVLNTLAVLNQASILRVHDVIEAKQVITLLQHYKKVE